MKQKELVYKVYKACFDKDNEQLAELKQQEFKKIFERKAKGKKFTGKWIVIKL